MTNIIEVKNLSFIKNNQTILKNINFTLKKHSITTIIGPNGAGKSSIIKSIANLNSYTGNVYLYNKDINKYKNKKEIAQKVGFVHQQNITPIGVNVYRYLQFGREPYKKNLLSSLSEKDLKRIDEVIQYCDLKKLLNKQLNDLSGGELQRVHLALGLIQEPDILILDEPTNNLDVKYKLEFLNLIKKLNREQGMSFLLILHDINLAAMFSDEIIIIKEGELLYKGKTKDVLNPNNLKKSFGVNAITKKTKNGLHIYFNI